MPCMGPSKDAAYDRADKITDDIIQILKNKYNIDPISMIEALNFGFHLKPEISDLYTNLRTVIRDLVWLDDCVSF